MKNHEEYSTELACALNGYRALIVPDVHDSDTQHWQSLWEHAIPRSRRIRLHDWHTADWVKWRNSIIASLISMDEPVVLIAEGFGALAAASVAAEYPGKIIAAFFVDPANPDEYDIRKKIPKQPLPISTKIITRTQTNTNAAFLATVWRADLAHANTTNNDSDVSRGIYWPEGISALNRLISNTRNRANEMTRTRTKKVLSYLRGIQQTHQSKQLGYQPS